MIVATDVHDRRLEAAARARGRPFRVGIMLDACINQRWVLDALRAAIAAPDIELAAIAVTGAKPRASLAARLHAFVERVDRRLRCRDEPLLAPVDVAAALDAADVIELEVVRDADGRWTPDAAGIAALERAGADVWLCFTAPPPRRPLPRVARCGVWGLEIGLDVAASDVWAGAAEIGTDSPVTTTSVIDYAAPAGGVVRRAVGATVRNSIARNRLGALRRAPSLFARAVRAANDDEWRARCAVSSDRPASDPEPRAPTVTGVARLCWRSGANVAANRWHKLRSREQWQIAYQFTRADADVDWQRLRYLVPPPDRFWADPFALEHSGRHFIFFEEALFSDERGRIMVVEVSADAEPAAPRVVLERPYHLSYPFLFTFEGALYLLPETGATGTIEVYRCESFPTRWRQHATLLEGVNGFDATLWKAAERWWMFVSVAAPGTDGNDELHLYSSSHPFGPWHAHPRNPVVADARRARPAGPLFERAGVLYRPSQDCAPVYGRAVVVNRVDVLDEDDYRETPVARIDPGWRADVLRVHTLGGSGPLRVIDYSVRRWRW